MSNILKNHFRVLEVISSLDCKSENKSDVDINHKVSNLKLVTLYLTAEFMSIDSESSLFKEINNAQISNLIERSQFNKRILKLFFFLEEIRTKLASKFLKFEDCFIVDSMPLEIWKFARHRRIKICKNEFETAPSKGVFTSQYNWFYRYKLHSVCSKNGIFHSLDILKAEVQDFHFLKNIKQLMYDCLILAGRGYLSKSIQLDLFQTVNIKFETSKTDNQKDYNSQAYIFRK